MEKLVIIGSGSGGLPVASTVAKNKKNYYDITVITKDSDIAYSPCGIPYVLKGDIASLKKLVMHTKEFYKELGIKILINTEVEEIDVKRQKIRFKDEWLDYDYLIIATGTSQRPPQIKNLKLKDIFSAHIKTIKEAENFDTYISTSKKPLQIVITGSGSIDLEFAIGLKEKNHQITVVEKAPHLMPDRLDEDMAEYVREYLHENGISVITGQNLLEVIGTSGLEAVVLDDFTLPADILLLGTDFIPEVTLAKKSGFETGKYGIKVDDRSLVFLNGKVVKNVFASGACAQVINIATGKPDFMYFGSTSICRSRIVAEQLLGMETCITGSSNPRIAVLGELHIGTVGINSKEAKDNNMEILSGFSDGKNTARYYPGGVPIYLKLLFENNSLKLVGAQIISTEKGVKERIDALSIGMSCGITAKELAHIETAYTPPVSSLVDTLVQAARKVWVG